jgi:hypothetical protein
MKATLCTGEIHAQNGVAVIPNSDVDLKTLWVFCTSEYYRQEVRKLSKKILMPSSALWSVPCDVTYWKQIAAARFPDGLPDPESDDPTQWLFHGSPAASQWSLQVAAARLLGYRWPAELDSKVELSQRASVLLRQCENLIPMADDDGIVPIRSVRGETPAAERLLDMLCSAYSEHWSESVLDTLLKNAGYKAGASLTDWLCNQLFEQHCKLFHNRPFVWHIWDGRKDGFGALVNYHTLDYKTLENLTYSYLGDWISSQAKSDKPGADLRLAAAQALQDKLKLILEGEPPYDIFVRWKPLHAQPIGWNPDLNDGVRMNIRPFVTAGILRKNPNIKWTKDRGKEPLRDQADYPWFWSGDTFVGDRVNDIHLTNAEKEAARNRREGTT